ncbi:hypothetical protein PFISCL1PPCAC_12287, partial [Pristionchus fissidentatus]
LNAGFWIDRARFFQMKIVQDWVENELIRNENISLCSKLHVSIEHRMSTVQEYTLAKLEDKETLKLLIKSDEFDSLPKETCVELARKLANFV